MPTLVLVRRQYAGSRSALDGPTTCARSISPDFEALRLAEVLPLLGPQTVFTATATDPLPRHRGLAAQLGLDLQSLPELGEEGFGADPEAGLAAVDRLLAPGHARGHRRLQPGWGDPVGADGPRRAVEGSRPYPPAAKGSGARRLTRGAVRRLLPGLRGPAQPFDGRAAGSQAARPDS